MRGQGRGLRSESASNVSSNPLIRPSGTFSQREKAKLPRLRSGGEPKGRAIYCLLPNAQCLLPNAQRLLPNA